MRFFNNLAETHKTLNHLPHWEQEDATYFVTWRLKDSIPQDLLDKIYKERDEWLRLHPTPLTEDEEMEFHKLFSTELDRLMDIGHGECQMRRPDCRAELEKSLRMFDGGRFLMHSWVMMPNHVHLLFTLPIGGKLERVIGAWKGYSAQDINVVLHREGPLWQKDYFDRMIRDWPHMVKVARYIRRNPVKAKLREGEYSLYEAEWVKRLLG